MTHTLSQLRKLNAQYQGLGDIRMQHEAFSELCDAMPDAMLLLERYHAALVGVVKQLQEDKGNIAYWGAYASKYSQEKRGLQEDLDKIDQLIKELTALLEEG